MRHEDERKAEQNKQGGIVAVLGVDEEPLEHDEYQDEEDDEFESQKEIVELEILQRANLAYDRLTKHLQELVSKQLLEERQEGDSRYYVLTPKGLEFIDNVRKAEAFVKGFGISL